MICVTNYFLAPLALYFTPGAFGALIHTRLLDHSFPAISVVMNSAANQLQLHQVKNIFIIIIIDDDCFA